MDPNRFRLSLWHPLLTAVFEVSHKFFLFRIHRNHRLFQGDVFTHLRVDMLELRIPVRMAGPFLRLPVRLQTVVQFME